MACDPQLSQAEREAAFEQQRNAGAIKAIRPFSGEATPENLVDYLNREVFPVLKQTRKAVNDVYRPVLDNAPSGNPLRHIFSTLTTGGDPTSGRLKLDNADASAATTVRLSQLNAGLADVASWLEVMNGSVTSPLGVVTLTHFNDPLRFVRYDLNTMVDQGTYWDLDVDAIEASSTTPFVEGDIVVLGFIPGVASGGTVVPPGSVTSTWADILANGNNSGAFNPHIDDGQFLSFGVEGALPGTGQLRSSADWAASITGAASFVGSTSVLVTGGGNGLSATSAAFSMGAGTTGILGFTNAQLQLRTNNVERLEIETTGAWQLGGLVGTAGQYLRSAGAGATPTWATISVGELGTIAAESFLGNFTAGVAAPAAVAGSTVAGAGLTYTTGGILAVGAGANVTVNANDVAVTNFPLTGLATQAANTIVANATAGAAAPTAVAVAADSVLARVGGNLVSHPWSTLFGTYLSYSAGVADWIGLDVRVNSGALTGTRHRLNVIGTAPVGVAAADDAGSDEVDVTITVSNIPLGSLATQADDTFLANISGGVSQPSAVALTTLAGAGLTGGADAILAVGAGTRITVNANDVQLAAGAAESFLMNATAGSAVADYRAGSSVAGAGLTYTAGGTLSVGDGAHTTVAADSVDVDLAAGFTWTGVHSHTGASHDIDVTGAVTIDADAASNFTTSVGNLTLSTTQAGTAVVISGADDVTIDAVADDIIVTSGGLTTFTSGTAITMAMATLFRVTTNSVERLEIEADGAWQVAGDTGTTGEVLTSQGNAADPVWSLPAGIVRVDHAQIDDATFSITPPTGATWFRLQMRGAGGGGGGADADTNGEACAAGGGAQGAWGEVWYPIVSGNITGHIGNGGTAGSNVGGNGGDGGDTSFTYNSQTYTVDGGTGGFGMNIGAGGIATANMKGAQGGVAIGVTASGTGHIIQRYRDGQAGFTGLCFGLSTTVANALASGGNGGGQGGGRGGLVVGGAGSSDGETGNGSGLGADGGGGGGAARIATGAATGATGGVGADGWLTVEFFSGVVPTGAGIT